MDERTDEEIILLVLNGQIHVFRQLVERHARLAYRTAFSVTQNHEEAQEVIQDAFIKAFSSLESFRRKSKFSTWLFRIVYHKALNQLEKSKSYRRKIYLGEAMEPDTHAMEDSWQSLINKDQTVYIGKALKQLSAQDRIALSLYYLEEKSQQEISVITGWNLASTKQRIHRARHRLDQSIFTPATREGSYFSLPGYSSWRLHLELLPGLYWLHFLKRQGRLKSLFIYLS